ncbi:MAG: reactive intermediate/imine deaminase [Oligoflexia bacterium]|nr:Rid family detoxifying hydrolase [Bdellovibrionales bacterium]MYE07333.1 reactive intermediate/imine deaminase [Oligoflexia bacterium]
MKGFSRRALSVDGLQPVGAYSQAIMFGPWVFLSGQIPLIPGTGEIVKGDIASQTERVMKNIQYILSVHQMSFQHIMKTSIFLKNMDHFPIVNRVYSAYFKEPFPARSCVAVQDLPKGVDIEIEAMACLK